MPDRPRKGILAVVTTKADHVAGAMPIFIVDTHEEVQQRALLLENLLGGMTHKVDEETYVVVRH